LTKIKAAAPAGLYRAGQIIGGGAVLFGPQFLLDRFLAGRPDLQDALSALRGSRIGIAPTDLPFAFVLDCRAERPTITLTRNSAEADAVIRGSVVTLIDLCDGRLDGDAAFFARRLRFEGNTAAVVALRNVLDGADVDLRRDLLARIERLPPPLRRIAELGAGVADRMFAVKRRIEENQLP
jgi:predicted lipid carrier protein YhbT